MVFIYDSKGVAVLSEEPDAFLTIFYFDKSETIICGRVSNGNQKGLTANYLSCNLNDTGLVAVGGTYKYEYKYNYGIQFLASIPQAITHSS